MRLSISNIAWDVSEDARVAALLRTYGVDAIDVAPGKYFPDPKAADIAEIQQVRAWWDAHGLEIVGMQALLFGTTGLNLFNGAAVQQAMLDHLDAVCRIGAALGATRLVFGSPRNRDRSGLSDQQADQVAVHFFRRLGDIAARREVIICLEPNPDSYGCNFATTSPEAARMVRLIDHAAIRMQLDTGAITMNGENPAQIVADNADIIGHIHASEPNLVTLADADTHHDRVADALFTRLPHHIVTIEMLAGTTEPHLTAIERALQVAVRHYRADSEGASL